MTNEDGFATVAAKGRSQCTKKINGVQCSGSCPNKRIVRGFDGVELRANCLVCGKPYSLPAGARKPKVAASGDKKLLDDNAELRRQIAEMQSRLEAKSSAGDDVVASGASGGAPPGDGTVPNSAEAQELDQRISGLLACIKSLKAIPLEGRIHLAFDGGNFDQYLAKKEQELQAARAAFRALKPLGDQLQSARSHLKKLEGWQQKADDELSRRKDALEEAQKSLEEQQGKVDGLQLEITSHKAHIARLEATGPSKDKDQAGPCHVFSTVKKFISSVDADALGTLNEAQRTSLSAVVPVLDLLVGRMDASCAVSEPSEFDLDMDVDDGELIASMARTALGLEESQEVPEDQKQQFETIKGNMAKGRLSLGKQLGKTIQKSKVRRTIH